MNYTTENKKKLTERYLKIAQKRLKSYRNNYAI
jgi:hypothetical protein